MSRYVIFPLQDKDVWKSYKDQVNSFWTVEEVSMKDDLHDWENKLNDNEREYLKHVLAFFAASDGIVAKNVDMNFVKEVEQRGWMEAMFAYQYQTMMENIHNEAYSKMIETLIADEEERNRLFNAIETVDSVKRKAEWALKWMGPNKFAKQLVAFAAVEGIFFSASFCAIYWLKFRGTSDPKNDGSLLPGVCKFNELISRDEGMHQSFACQMYKREVKRDPNEALSQSEIQQIIAEAVEYEKQFATESLPVNLLGMSGESMCKHIEVVADRLLQQLGCEKMYNAKEPFSWLDLISMNRKTNFFEERPTEYAKAGSGAKGDDTANAITFDAEF